MDDQCIECGGTFSINACEYVTCGRELHAECGITCDFCGRSFCTQHSEAGSHQCSVYNDVRLD